MTLNITNSILNELTALDFPQKRELCFTFKNNRVSSSVNIENILLSEESNISISSSDDVTLYNCDLSRYDLRSLDTDYLKFKKCKWSTESGRPLGTMSKLLRIEKVKHNDFSKMDLEEIVDYKNIFTSLRRKFQLAGEYTVSEAFRYSESNAMLATYLKRKQFVNSSALYINRSLSGYGTNYLMPLSYLMLLVLLFSILYLFTGLQIGTQKVEYELAMSVPDYRVFVRDFFQSLIFSFKNIVPFTIARDFYIKADSNLLISQTLVIIQKSINIVILGSFIFAFRRFLLKK